MKSYFASSVSRASILWNQTNQAWRWRARLQSCRHAAAVCFALALAIPSTAWADLEVTSDQTQNGGTLTISPDGVLVVSDDDNPQMTLTSGANSSGVQAVIVGNLNGDAGQLLIQGGSELDDLGHLPAFGPYGIFSILGGRGYLGLNAGSTGSATVSGSNSVWNVSEQMYVGYAGAGTLTVQDAGVVTNGFAYLGYEPNSSGNVTVTGNGSLWDTNGNLFVGNLGAGELLIEAGGEVTTYGGLVGGVTAQGQGTATVTGLNSNWAAGNNLYVGYFGVGELLIDDQGSVTNSTGYIGYNPTGDGSVTVSGNGSAWHNSANLYVGGKSFEAGGTAALEVLDDGLVTVGGTTKLWSNAAAITIDGGTFTTGSLDRAVGVLQHHDGVLRVNGGALIQPTGALLVSGNTANAVPKLELLAGANATIANGVESVVVGGLADRNGELLISGASTLSNIGDASVLGNVGSIAVQRGFGYLGLNAGASGSATITGSGSEWTNSHELQVGVSGTGNLLIEAGGSATMHTGYLGYSSGSTGEVVITGAGSNWNSYMHSYVGNNGHGHLQVLNGGTMSSNYGIIAQGYASISSAVIDGENSVWTNVGNFYVGSAGLGTLEVTNGGAVVSDDGIIASNSSATGIATFTGLGSTWTNDEELRVGSEGVGTLNIFDGANVSSDIVNVARFAGSMGHSTIEGAGALLAIDSGLYVGGTQNGEGGVGIVTINDGGMVQVAGGNPAIIWASGTLAGAGGTLAANVTNHGIVAPGISPGMLTIDGNYEQSSSGELQIELAGLLAGDDYDQLAVTGDVALDGLLDVSLIDGFELGLNQWFEILTTEGTLTGTFSGLNNHSVVGNYGGVDLFIAYTSSGPDAGVALYTAVPEPSGLLLAAIAGAGVFGLARRQNWLAAKRKEDTKYY